VTRRLPCFAACLLASVVLLPSAAEAQIRRGPRVAARATIVVGAPYRSYFYDPWYPYDYWYPSPYYYGPRNYYYDDTASVRIEGTPRQAEVFVDGYYAGIVDDFDGTFQRLNVEPGEHDLQLFLPGHRPFNQRVYVQPRTTFRLRFALERLAPGEPEPLRPGGGATQNTGARAQGPSTRRAPIDRGPVDRGPGGRAPADRETGARSDYGTLAIRVQPGDAEIVIDGERWEGPSGDERLVVQLAPGSHRIEVRKQGYRPYTSEIGVRSGETSPVNVALAR
jgi:hypothetical protein